ncbi:hypothetical protein ACFSKN_13625 [Mariniflexile gromovii]|uniref:Outer membrane efflux protein n=1 Tax=Mariniflexile gromovii TaxID=362523 RepID=A0ABS4BQZ7_9FLAO|nr:hypothetical protein [Mariniflexile gromovii]MBP0903008.1 hypothetical protein [Mariniflexile gromovii]
MKKVLSKHFLFLVFLCFSGLVSARTISISNVSQFSYLKKYVQVLESNADTVKQDLEIATTSIERLLEIKITEVEIEESLNFHSKKTAPNTAVIPFSIALQQPFHIYKKDKSNTESFNFYIPNKRYITYQVFRI